MALRTTKPLSARVRARQTARRSAVSVRCAHVEPKKILLMGGTRFIGLYLARQLVEQGHDVTLFTRGKKAVTSKIADDTDSSYNNYARRVKHIAGDRMDFEDMQRKIAREGFQVVYDINGREAAESEAVLKGTKSTLEQFIYCSSAGVYLKNDQMPHREEDATDPKSRHKGKLETEAMLDRSGVAYTSIRPVYIYGPLNYNPVEEWFFHRLHRGGPIAIPGSGAQVTQLGHVKDLANAFVKTLGNKKAYGQVYNISGERFVTFNGIAKAAAEAMNLPEPEIVNYNPKDFDFGKEKAFPMRDQHFFTSIDKAMADLDWKPEFDLVDGLRDSYLKDFGLGNYRKEPNLALDDMILAKFGKRAPLYTPPAKKSAAPAKAAAAPVASSGNWWDAPSTAAPAKAAAAPAASSGNWWDAPAKQAAPAAAAAPAASSGNWWDAPAPAKQAAPAAKKAAAPVTPVASGGNWWDAPAKESAPAAKEPVKKAAAPAAQPASTGGNWWDATPAVSTPAPAKEAAPAKKAAAPAPAAKPASGGNWWDATPAVSTPAPAKEAAPAKKAAAPAPAAKPATGGNWWDATPAVSTPAPAKEAAPAKKAAAPAPAAKPATGGNWWDATPAVSTPAPAKEAAPAKKVAAPAPAAKPATGGNWWDATPEVSTPAPAKEAAPAKKAAAPAPAAKPATGGNWWDATPAVSTPAPAKEAAPAKKAAAPAPAAKPATGGNWWDATPAVDNSAAAAKETVKEAAPASTGGNWWDATPVFNEPEVTVKETAPAKETAKAAAPATKPASSGNWWDSTPVVVGEPAKEPVKERETVSAGAKKAWTYTW